MSWMLLTSNDIYLCLQMVVEVAEVHCRQRRRGWTRPHSSEADLFRPWLASSHQHRQVWRHHHTHLERGLWVYVMSKIMLFMQFTPWPPLGRGYSQSQSDDKNTDPHGYSSPRWRLVHSPTSSGYLWRHLSRFQWALISQRRSHFIS